MGFIIKILSASGNKVPLTRGFAPDPHALTIKMSDPRPTAHILQTLQAPTYINTAGYILMDFCPLTAEP